MTDNPLVSYGWCMPSEVFLNILTGNVPPVDPEPECVEHRWIRRILSSACECSHCAHEDWTLECDVCCEWWDPDGLDHVEWKAVWDSLE